MTDMAKRNEVNRFFVQLFGRCFHEMETLPLKVVSGSAQDDQTYYGCRLCYIDFNNKEIGRQDYFDGNGFFALLEFAMGQPFWVELVFHLAGERYYNNGLPENLAVPFINVNVFPLELYEFLIKHPEHTAEFIEARSKIIDDES